MTKIVAGQSVKRPGFPIADGSESGSKKRSREQVEVLEDVWIVALKHLSCPKWSKMLLVSRQLNGLVKRNVSRLPLAIIDYAAIVMDQREETESEIIASDFMISKDEKIEWFKDRGITFYLPADIELNNAIIGFELKKNICTDLCFLGLAQEEELTPHEKTRPWFSGLQFKVDVLFYAEFSPHRNPYSWPSMAYFLKVLYDPSTRAQELSMYALDKKLKDIVFPGEKERYIRCGSFKFLCYGDKLSESLSWLKQNVQADKIVIPTILDYKNEEICDAMSNFVLDSTWIIARPEVNLGLVNELINFFRALIKKFRTLSAVQRTFPIITFVCYRFYGFADNEQVKRLLSGKEELDDSEDKDGWEYSEEIYSEKKGETYTISNGAKRMQINITEAPPRVPNASKCADIRVTVETGFCNAIQ